MQSQPTSVKVATKSTMNSSKRKEKSSSSSMKKSNNGHSGLLMKKTRKKKKKLTRLQRKSNTKKFSCTAEDLEVQSREKSLKENKHQLRWNSLKKKKWDSSATLLRQ